jgi:hypothetical protein
MSPQDVRYFVSEKVKGKVVRYTPWRCLGRGGIAPPRSELQQWKGMRVQGHALDALYPPGRGPPVRIVQEAGWAPGPCYVSGHEIIYRLGLLLV